MDNQTLYCLMISAGDRRQSFDFEKSEDARGAFDFITEKFSDEIVSNRDEVVRSQTKIAQVKVVQTYVGSVPAGAMAAFTPEEWFDEKATGAIIEAADRYFQKVK